MFRGTHQSKERFIFLLVFFVPPTVIPWDGLSLQESQKAGVDVQASSGLSQSPVCAGPWSQAGSSEQGRSSVADTVNGSNC